MADAPATTDGARQGVCDGRGAGSRLSKRAAGYGRKLAPTSPAAAGLATLFSRRSETSRSEVTRPSEAPIAMAETLQRIITEPLRRARACRSRSCCPMACACRCPRSRPSTSWRARWKGLRALARPAHGRPRACLRARRPRFHRQRPAHARHRRLDGRRRRRMAASRARARWKLFLHQQRSEPAQHLAPLRRLATRSTGCGSTSAWSTRAPISATTPTRSTRRRRKSSTTSAASCDWRRGERFLDIGCGWGGLLFHAAQTLWRGRHRHHAVAKPVRPCDAARSPARGLAGRVRVELRDYLDLPDDGLYDKVASVGMFEHVGVDPLPDSTSARSTGC